MEHARRKSFEANERPESVYIENTLDGRKVLECLETDLDNDDDRNRIVGIGNGLLLGAALWIVLATAVVVSL